MNIDVIEGIIVSLTGFGAMLIAGYKYYSSSRKKDIEEIREIVKTESSTAKLTKTILEMKSTSDLIMDHLESLQKHLSSDLIWLGLFHNGQYTIGGEHLVKLSSLYEIPRGGYIKKDNTKLSTMDIVDNIPLLHMGEWITENLNDNWYVKNVDDIDSPILKESFLSWRLKSGVNVIIYEDDTKTTPIGVVGICWVENNFDLLEFLGVTTTRGAVVKLRKMLKGLTSLVVGKDKNT